MTSERLIFCPQHTSHADARNEVTTRPGRSGSRCRNSIASCADEQPHVGNYRLLKTIGKGNFAKVKLARHILTGREVRPHQTPEAPVIIDSALSNLYV
jgi:serine/threonine protein kinase